MIRTIAGLLFLLLPSLGWGQDTLTLAKRPDAVAVATAKETIRSAAQSPTMLAHQGYVIIDIKLEGKLSNYVVPGSDDCIKTIFLPKGVGYSGWFVPKTGGLPVWTVIEPVATHDRLIVTGVSTGTTTLIWMTVQNGEAVVVAAFQFVVGKPVPKPDDPPLPDDPLVKAFRAAKAQDVAAGKGDKKWLLPLAGVYLAASNDTLESLATMNDLDTRLNSARIAAGIPDPDNQFLNLRRAVQTELYRQLGVNQQSGTVELKPDTRRLAKATMAKIAASLEEIAK